MHSDKGNGHTDLGVLGAQVSKEIAPAVSVSIGKVHSIVSDLIRRAVFGGAHVEEAKKSWTEKQTSACLFGAAVMICVVVIDDILTSFPISTNRRLKGSGWPNEARRAAIPPLHVRG